MGHGLFLRTAAALAVVAGALAAGRPAYAQKPVIFEGQSPVVSQAKATVNGRPASTTLLVEELQLLNNPSFLVLYPNGVAGYIPSNLSALGLPTVPPLLGTVHGLPNGSLAVSGGAHFQFGASTVTASVNGVVTLINGRFYAVLNYAGVTTTPTTSGTKTEVDTATIVIPLTVVPS
jgi:hypothetical protein